MRKLFVLIALVSLMFSEGNLHSQYAPEKVKGGYRTCIMDEYIYVSGEVDSNKEEKIYIAQYDKAGNMIHWFDYELNMFKVFKTNKFGNIIERAHYNSDSSVYMKISKIKYDTNGNKIEFFFELPGANASAKCQYKYDSSDKMIEEIWFNEEGNIYRNFRFYYNSSGKQVNKIFFDIDMNIGWVSEQYKYDRNGNKIEEICFNSDGSLLSECRYKYDEYGNVIEECVFGGEGELSRKHVYEYSR